MKLFLIGLVSLVCVLHFFHNSTPTSTPNQVGMRNAEHGAYSPTQYPHNTVKILDGDTFVLNGEHVRLIGMNAPEIYHKGKGKADCGAYQSMSRLEYYLTRIRPASDIQIQREGKDKYGRTLALVFISGSTTPINQLMVREGFAETFRPEGGVPAPDYTADALIAIDKLAGNLSHCTYP